MSVAGGGVDSKKRMLTNVTIHGEHCSQPIKVIVKFAWAVANSGPVITSKTLLHKSATDREVDHVR